MVILLDTNSLVWLLDGGDKFGTKARATIVDADAIYASAINVTELTIKAMLGKIIIPDELEEAIQSAGLKMQVYTSTHADTLRQFPELVRHDPFDRMLLATAKTEGITLMTSDKVLLDLGLEYVISARF